MRKDIVLTEHPPAVLGAQGVDQRATQRTMAMIGWGLRWWVGLQVALYRNLIFLLISFSIQPLIHNPFSFQLIIYLENSKIRQ
jgi:hypothetical protein